MHEGIEAIRQALKETAEHIRPPASLQLQRKVMKELELLNNNGDLLGKVTVDTLGDEDPIDQIIQQLTPGRGKRSMLRTATRTESSATRPITRRSLGMKG
ncbi:hypothetical protein [Paenibacillus thiaminolyticus]|uniref:hypothetical protein n=1 Tax=Paenibacillus thiaminolyticus TaxID=49283 RepID=UPI0025430A96|nr:hypothetical protein [Paenibacillus thiaminolyticus]WII37539.1 hypothetical protein O0V01_28870 [Paenibacillus thiaminolyticus]